MKGCDYVVETIPEVMDTKKATLAQIEAINSDVIIASNTGSFTITELAQGMKNPGQIDWSALFQPGPYYAGRRSPSR